MTKQRDAHLVCDFARSYLCTAAYLQLWSYPPLDAKDWEREHWSTEEVIMLGKAVVGHVQRGRMGLGQVIEFLKAFNSRTYQVVLSAGAMRSAGLKNIKAKYLGRYLMLIKFDKLKTLWNVDWDQPKQGESVNDYVELVNKETITPHKVLSRYLAAPVVEDLWDLDDLCSCMVTNYHYFISRSCNAQEISILLGQLPGMICTFQIPQLVPPTSYDIRGIRLEHTTTQTLCNLTGLEHAT
ncbi:uncharacterized protein F5147DRAFT_652917 [Suillus discolor]|uniref:Vacuolar protein sorting-associated protein 54 C-terminal domain-containing protein n=1 Tax=Suillus discolor TaxID=1912936 RepID=A0A9P7F792_9AGAM|nr:uncharacterized protein F5147DRAFT_652917 [Suillus discolor]KAG2108194.1 hypothetical protein F5147DRAFT_652917 [Suillus discolor]